MPANSGLTAIDWVVIAVYAVSTIALGWYFGRKQNSTSEYFVGNGKMNPVLIGVSLFATLLSTISYLAGPGEMIAKGPVDLAKLLALPLVYLVVAYILLPVYMRQRVTSAYELLEEKLGLSLRLFAALMFLLLRLVWMTLLVYLASKAMTVMMGIDESRIPWIVLITGAVSITYTSMGGLRAVVITDLLQTVLLLGGALLVIAVISIDLGGFNWFPTSWQSNWDVQPVFDFNPKTRVTVLGTIASVSVWFVCTAGGDQVSVQRFMATHDVGAARKALAIQLVVVAVVAVTLSLVGFALLGYFKAHPDFMVSSINFTDKADQVFPHFIAYHLPVGVSGLVVAAMFAAAMSSIDSGVNSISAVVMTDFFDRLSPKPISEGQRLRIARLLAIGIGATIVLGSLFIGNLEGNITKVTGKVVNLLVAPLFSLFFFALFVRSAQPLGVWIGSICGLATAFVVGFSGAIVLFLHQHYGVDPATFGTEIVTRTNPITQLPFQLANDPISFQWIGPASLAVSTMTGWTACKTIEKCKREIETPSIS